MSALGLAGFLKGFSSGAIAGGYGERDPSGQRQPGLLERMGLLRNQDREQAGQGEAGNTMLPSTSNMPAAQSTTAPGQTGTMPTSQPQPAKPLMTQRSPLARITFGNDVDKGIDTAAAKYGLDPAVMSQIAKIESGGDPRALNQNNKKAAGAFQFMPDTAAGYGLTDPYDPIASADAAARLMRDNGNYLSKALGRAPTPGEIYLAHQQGAGGAEALLRDPSANAVDALATIYSKRKNPRAAALAAIKGNGGNANMTAGDFAGLWTSRLDGNAEPQRFGSVARALAGVRGKGKEY